MKDRMILGVLALISTILGIIIGVHQLGAEYVTNKQFEERKANVEKQFTGVEKKLDEIKTEQAEFRRETNRKLDDLLERP